jgi:hypothetical protein
MQNERLRAAMAAGGWTCATLAAKAEVDPKSVERCGHCQAEAWT